MPRSLSPSVASKTSFFVLSCESCNAPPRYRQAVRICGQRINLIRRSEIPRLEVQAQKPIDAYVLPRRRRVRFYIQQQLRLLRGEKLQITSERCCCWRCSRHRTIRRNCHSRVATIECWPNSYAALLMDSASSKQPARRYWTLLIEIVL